jgi:hypothetical protein
MRKRLKIRYKSPEWYEYRSQGIGGSEIAGVLGISQHTDPIKIHLEKIGEPVTKFNGNTSSFFGSLHEDEIADLYKYWDHANPGMDVLMRNFEQKQVINQIVSSNFLWVNSKYPWLFASVDKLIKRNKKLSGILECKNTTKMEARRYVNNVSPAFYVQALTYTGVLEKDFFGLAIELDGNDFDAHLFDFDKTHFEKVVEKSYSFWRNVLEAKKIKLEYDIESYYGINPDFMNPKQREGVEQLQALEPDLRGTDTELDFIKEMVVPTPEFTKIEGDDDLHKELVGYIQADDMVSKYESVKNAHKAKMILHLGGAHEAEFPDGSITYKPNKNGVPSFRVANKLLKSYRELL